VIFGISHAALLTTLPESTNAVAGPVGWFLYLVLITELNDISQALVGRQFGHEKRHPISPTVSPNKTWEGFLGGMLVTVLLSLVLAPLLTPLHLWTLRSDSSEPSAVAWFWPITSASLLSLGGFLGDINMSALKRDRGVKDSGRLLPGMGGMLDRIDSLTFNAPLFYCLVRWWGV
jgi:phosphatidate cytidylyltransferase